MVTSPSAAIILVFFSSLFTLFYSLFKNYVFLFNMTHLVAMKALYIFFLFFDFPLGIQRTYTPLLLPCFKGIHLEGNQRTYYIYAFTSSMFSYFLEKGISKKDSPFSFLMASSLSKLSLTISIASFPLGAKVLSDTTNVL